MVELSSTQKKVLDIFNNDGVKRAWNYWKLMGNTYGIFLGEVPSNEFIDGGTLANHIGLTEGVLCNADTPWLKFLLDERIIYVPMKPLIHTITWDTINESGAVFENEGVRINIGGKIYDVTLLRGANVNSVDTVTDDTGFDLSFTHNSEWNRLMYPIHSGIHTNTSNPSYPSIPYAQWATYSDEDLLIEHGGGVASVSWTQETPNNSVFERLVRGGFGVAGVGSSPNTYTNSSISWRPTLRLI